MRNSDNTSIPKSEKEIQVGGGMILKWILGEKAVNMGWIL